MDWSSDEENVCPFDNAEEAVDSPRHVECTSVSYLECSDSSEEFDNFGAAGRLLHFDDVCNGRSNSGRAQRMRWRLLTQMKRHLCRSKTLCGKLV